MDSLEETINSTVHPSCLQEPPLAIDVIKELDVFGICLYSMLTLMSCLSLLLYLDTCVYIYRKVSYPKKTTITWINGAAPFGKLLEQDMAALGRGLGDFLLKTLLMKAPCERFGQWDDDFIYLCDVTGIHKEVTHFVAKAVAMVLTQCIAVMSCFGMWIPRSVMFTDMTSNCYFAVVVYKILVLIVEEHGGSSTFLQKFSGKPFKISTGPCCCCCVCLPPVPMSRRMLFWMKLGALQYAILKTVLSILCIILWTNGNFDLADLEITGTAIWINPFIGVLTIISLWPVGIMFMNTNSLLRHLRMVPKYAMYQLVLILSQLQTSIINILALDGTIACSPPFSSQARGSMLSQQMMIMEMFIITLVTRCLYRRTYDGVSHEEQNGTHNGSVALKAAPEEQDV